MAHAQRRTVDHKHRLHCIAIEAFKQHMGGKDVEILEVPDVARVHWKHSSPRVSLDTAKVENFLRSKGEDPLDFKKTSKLSRAFRLYDLNRRSDA